MSARAPIATTQLVDAIKDGPKLRAWDRHKREVLVALRDQGPLWTKDAVRAVPALTTQFYRLADELADEGLVDKTMMPSTSGWGRGGKRARWSITEYGVAWLTGRRL
jgi:hypothetical protein